MVSVEHTIEDLQHNYREFSTRNIPSDTSVEYHRYEVTKKVYVCPRGKPSHRGSPMKCRHKCVKEESDDPIYEDEVKQHMLAVKTKISLITD
jgi:hypothetical protein